MHAANQLKQQTDIHFYIIGDGPVKENLLALQQQLQLCNITFIENQPSEKIIEWLNLCDAYIVPLRKLDLFKGAIPSKLFEPLALVKPVLLGVEGEAKELFIDNAKGGLFYEPENAHELANAITLYTITGNLQKNLGNSGQTFVNTYFRRDKIAEAFWQQLHNLYS